MIDDPRRRRVGDEDALADEIALSDALSDGPGRSDALSDGPGQSDALPDGSARSDALPDGRAGSKSSPDGPERSRPSEQTARPRQDGDGNTEPPAGPVSMSKAAPHPEPDSASGASAARPSAQGWWARRRARRRAKDAEEHRKAPWWELPALIALAIAIAIIVKTFLIQPFYIPSESMEHTLYGCNGCSGDRILVNKLIYDFRDPHPGDVVVFHAPPGWDDEPRSVPPSNPVLRAIRGFGQLIGFVPPDGLVLVKRVIAVGGQTVRGFSHNGGRTDVVQISDNGPGGPWRTLHETYLDMHPPDNYANFGPVTVPKGRLWVMGDHRGDSADSRFHCDAANSGDGQDLTRCNAYSSTVPIKDAIGKAFVIAWPPSRWRTLGTPSTFSNDAAGRLVVPAAAAVIPAFALRRRRRRRRSAHR